MRLTRVLAAATIAASISGFATTATASADELPGYISVHNATQFTGDDTQADSPSFCTIGAVGTDRYGRNVGITAGHCFAPELEHPLDEVNITDNSKDIYDRNNLNWKEGGNERGSDPIGYLRWFKDPDGATAGHVGRDYAVIEFVEGVVLSSQGPHIKMTGILEIPNGTISSPYATAPAEPREKVLGTGIFTNHQLIHSSLQSGVWYGRITNNSAAGIVGVYQAFTHHVAGDSGGPAIIKDANAPLPTEANGLQTQGKWAGITRALIIGWPIYSYTSSANILADLRTRDLASGQDGSVVGAGFQVTTNP
jgi:hypothetical protein